MPYKYLEDVSIADVAFEAYGNSLNELFEQSGMAVTNTMVKDMKPVKKRFRRKIQLKSTLIETLLFNFLNEIIFYKDKERLLFSSYRISVSKKGKMYYCNGIAIGDKISMKRHDLVVDVKAVTMHLFEVRQESKIWKSRVVLDI